MLTYYLVLGLSLDASDEEIRQSYLQQVKKYTPEANPEKFRQITEAYEALKDKRNRIRRKILGGFITRNTEEALHALAIAGKPKRKRVGLKKLFEIGN